ncbi:MAG: cytochrome c [Acidobacteriota bacterium]|nr:cytochrome c [Acidobacteriota bacterium]
MRVQEPLTVVEQAERRRLWKWALILLALILVLAAVLYWRFHPNRPTDYDDIVEHFKYGSIGSEAQNGIPYWIVKVLPEMFPEYLPGKGYASLGLLEEPGRDLPIGFAKRRVVFDRVGLNCAVCHVGTVRDAPGGPRRVIAGMPANNLDLQGYVNFLTACAKDPRFTTDNVLAAIESKTDLGPVERFIYRQAIPLTREAFIEQGFRMAFMQTRPAWGPGRVDTFNPYKSIQFHWPMENDKTIGTSDLPPIWNQRPREGLQLHWDGNNTSVEERNKSAALGAGVTPSTIDLARLKRIEDWLLDFKAPPYPYEVDQARAARGRAVYEQGCASCHSFGGAQTGRVTHITEIGTDPHRLDSYTYLLTQNQNLLYAGYDWRFKNFRKTDGYANMPLDGVWLRAPYLHNGSVPTLRALLDPPEQRPKQFYRGNDVFDRQNVGFVSDVAEEGGRRYFLYDTSLPGNWNAGHLYGTDLPPEDKDALVEYLKTL